jgi:large subunit ribosomal protein L19
MSIHPIMQKLAEKFQRTDLPEFAPGDLIRVQVKIKEGDKERLQAFEGMVIHRAQDELRPGRRTHLSL